MPHMQGDPHIYYEVHGSGEPVILISGLGGDLGFWQDTVAALQSQFQVIVFDNRGIGRSDAPDMPYSMELFADDIAGLMDEIGIARAHLVGFSMGGCVAQAFALRHADRVDKVVIAASYARMGAQAELFLDAVLSVYESGATSEQMYRLILPWLFSPAFLNAPNNARPFLEFDPDDPLQQPLYAFRRQYCAQKEFDSRSRLHEIQKSALVLIGECDALVPVQDARELADGIKQAHFAVVPGSGHLINVEKPDIFHEAIAGFLNGP